MDAGPDPRSPRHLVMCSPPPFAQSTPVFLKTCPRTATRECISDPLWMHRGIVQKRMAFRSGHWTKELCTAACARWTSTGWRQRMWPQGRHSWRSYVDAIGRELEFRKLQTENKHSMRRFSGRWRMRRGFSSPHTVKSRKVIPRRQLPDTTQHYWSFACIPHRSTQGYHESTRLAI